MKPSRLLSVLTGIVMTCAAALAAAAPATAPVATGAATTATAAPRAGGAEDTDRFRVTLLGTGTPVPSPARAGYSTLVEAGGQKLVFDFGRNVSVRLWQLRIPLGSVDAHFLTHFHSDHLVGLPDLWLTGWLRPPYGRRDRPMALYGPAGTRALADGLRQAFAADIAIRHKDEGSALTGITIDAHDVAPGVVYEKDGVRVTAFENDHGDHIRPSYGYRIDYRGRSVVLSGDTRFSPAVVAQARNADVLVHCVTLIPDALLASNPAYRAIYDHLSSPEDAARVFQAAAPKLAVFSHIGLNGDATVGHIVERVRKTYAGGLLVGEDLTRIEIGLDGRTGTSGGIAVWQEKP
ncbi:Ribonuclease Z [Cupriavidus taiwanensis]|uniref:MBL fold metallo-hydrolase n=1 Tax=Cupriavidus taiwanensis TaxID=164546 RepID=UPI000E1085B3|nr:MBL fold metallo-hydrolase [Cupriavidus taiwanensis]SPA40836.1 Ribonuclease Z [Cupriavidus taiwanensis]SPA41763.1 Ribonuclease Z [Cupriavidus taiwanensis]